MSRFFALALVATSLIDPVAIAEFTYPHSGTGVPWLEAVMSTAASPSSETDPSVATDVDVIRD